MNDIKHLKQKHPKAVIIFPHTSAIDAYIMLLYKIRYKSLFKDMYFLTSNNRFKLDNMIDTNFGNTIDRSIELLDKIDNGWLFISPEGDCDPKPWKSGYYLIAKQLNIPIIVLGYDYNLGKLLISGIVENIDDIEKTQNQCIEYMNHICPMNPGRSFYKPDDKRKFNRFTIFSAFNF